MTVRAVPCGPLEAQVLAEREGGSWRPVLTTRGPDALARAQDLARLLEVGLLSVAGNVPREVSAEEHPEVWVTLAAAVEVLRESPAVTVARVERGELRTLNTERGLYVRAEDLLAVARDQVDEAQAWRLEDVVRGGCLRGPACLCPGHVRARGRVERAS